MRGAMLAFGVWLVVSGGVASAQQAAPQTMGTVATSDALVSGGLEVQGERARLMSNASVTAYERTASIELERGGEIMVCATSQFHLLHSGTGRALLFGLDRGAIELHGDAEGQDVILTPDVRFSVEAKGSYDLRLRVTRGGDTCVENAGAHSPVFMLNDAFSDASYRLMPGQHVLFEHGSLREVVDNERSACGCPAATIPAVLASNATVADKAKVEHPFPAAASEGLVAAPATAPAATTSAEATFNYRPAEEPTVTPVQPAPQPRAPVVVSTAPPPAPPGAHDIAHKIGRFFHRLFHPAG